MSEKILQEIIGDFKSLNNRVAGLGDGLMRLDANIQRLGNRMATLETRMDTLEIGQQALASCVESLEVRPQKLETRLENEVIEKIGGPFNGYSLRGAQIENL